MLNIAELVRVAPDRPGAPILNIRDPEALTVAEIGSAIARHMGYAGKFIEVATSDFPAKLGRKPWAGPRPFVLDNSAALAMGYVPVTTYAEAAEPIWDDLANGEADRDCMPVSRSCRLLLRSIRLCAEDALLKERAA